MPRSEVTPSWVVAFLSPKHFAVDSVQESTTKAWQGRQVKKQTLTGLLARCLSTTFITQQRSRILSAFKYWSFKMASRL